MNVLDLFSGIGGFSLGLERAGMRTVAFCEIDPFCRKVLAKHWPGVPCFDDVRSLTAARLRSDGIVADVICGGFPCQDISQAGKRAGIDGERSGLWSEYARIIGEVRPRYVIVENVAALLGRGIDRVLGDLAALGYDAEWHGIPASAIGARHRRDRIWIVAHPVFSEGVERHVPDVLGGWSREAEQTGLGGSDVAHAERQRVRGSGHRSDVATPSEVGGEVRQQRVRVDAEPGREALADTKRRRLQSGDVECSEPPAIIPAALGGYCGGSEFGAPWWSEPDVGRVAHGIPDAMDRLKGLGNAVVPQIPEIIGRAIMRASTVTSQEHQSHE